MTSPSSLVRPREVFKGAYPANAAAIVCAHSHRSGDLSPSVEDWALYDRIRDAGRRFPSRRFAWGLLLGKQQSPKSPLVFTRRVLGVPARTLARPLATQHWLERV